jgi:hypothetical protein
MMAALGSIAALWIGLWFTGHRASSFQQIFAAVCAQSVAAILLSFSSGSLLLSFALAAVILGAIFWMIQSSKRFSSQPLHKS